MEKAFSEIKGYRDCVYLDPGGRGHRTPSVAVVFHKLGDRRASSYLWGFMDLKEERTLQFTPLYIMAPYVLHMMYLIKRSAFEDLKTTQKMKKLS